jgi:hypothetical protein
MPSNKNFESGQPEPDSELSKLKVNADGAIYDSETEKEADLPRYYIDRYNQLGEVLDKATLDKRLQSLDKYVEKINYALAGGQSSADLHLLTEIELNKKLVLLVETVRDIIQESLGLLTIPVSDVQPAQRQRAKELLVYIQEIKDRRRALLDALQPIQKFSDQELRSQTKLSKDQWQGVRETELNFENVINTDLFISYRDLSNYENKLFNLSRSAEK